jgi:signal transduction histidine kinase
VTRQGKPVAALETDANVAVSPAAVELAATMAAMGIDNDRLLAVTAARVDDVQRAASRLLAAAEEARHRLAVDVSSGPRAALVEAREALSGRDGPHLRTTCELLRLAAHELRELSHGLTPRSLTTAGLGPALEELSGRSGAGLRCAGDVGELPPALATTCYLAVAEALRAGVPVAVEMARANGKAVVVTSGGAEPSPDLAARVATLNGSLQRTGDTVTLRLPVP